MGTGKSAVGNLLAQRLHREFFDTDTLIEQTAGLTIARIFAEKGESSFRELEKQIIRQVCQKHEVVIATGGGAIVNVDNATCLKESGTVICLTASPETIVQRVQGNEDRPLLQGEEPLTKIRSLLTTRAEAYARADVTIDTSALNPSEVVDMILALVQV
ncbi:MAG: shikimate kinase [Deltaproteobacteria bacterium]|nr:shikimate kinase [Deltaproteobacteria bacterium]